MNRKILIVDDQQDIRDTLKGVLSSYNIITVCDGAAALGLIRSERPALVLLDVSMPGMSGLEVLEKISAMGSGPLVILLTADDAIETAAKGIAAGAFAYITKPFETHQIREQVAKALGFWNKNHKNVEQNNE